VPPLIVPAGSSSATRQQLAKGIASWKEVKSVGKVRDRQRTPNKGSAKHTQSDQMEVTENWVGTDTQHRKSPLAIVQTGILCAQ